MKALSFRQPWAELILQGRKTLDLRTYQTNHRGPLAVYAPKTVDKAACRAYNIDPETVQTGGVLGIVDVVDIMALDEDSYSAQQEAHLSALAFDGSLYGWQLRNPRRLPQVVPAVGRMSLFNVDIEDVTIAEADAQEVKQPPAKADQPEPISDTSTLALRNLAQPTPPLAPEARQQGQAEAIPAQENFNQRTHPFLLTVDPAPGAATDYGLSLFQRKLEFEQNGLYSNEPLKGTAVVVALSGDNLRAVASYVIEALRQSGYKATDLSTQRRKPFYLHEEVGVRLGLLFLAVKPLSKMVRVETIAHGIRQMPLEEVYYWYSKCSAAESADRAQKALRVLLAEE
jgi:hypothetical protein